MNLNSSNATVVEKSFRSYGGTSLQLEKDIPAEKAVFCPLNH